MLRLSSSHLPAPIGAKLSEVASDRPIFLTVVLRPGLPIHIEAYADGKVLSHAEYTARHGTPQSVLNRVVEHARACGLHVVEASATKHAVRLKGSYAQASQLFQPDGLGMYELDGKSVAARHGHISVPDDLADDIVAVIGFDERPIVRPHFRLGSPTEATATAWDPLDVADHYLFPEANGFGQTIGLIELGGGYDPEAMASYFARKGIKRTGKLVSSGVDGARNAPERTSGGPDGEVQLDIEIAGSVAPAADIVVYFGPNTAVGFIDVLQAAIDDQVNKPAIMSLSWGAPESAFSRQDVTALDQTLQSAVALGITVCVASGDAGASDGVADGHLHVNFPASSPHALGCGGTRLPRSGAEVAWNDGDHGGASGGGFSAIFSRQAWQSGTAGAMRGVPDVAGNADPMTGYRVEIDGAAAVIGGTSAVAPLWAGLVARLNQVLGRRLGFANPLVYRHTASFTDITTGSNNGYETGPGWDPVTGLGSPLGAALLASLRGARPEDRKTPTQEDQP